MAKLEREEVAEQSLFPGGFLLNTSTKCLHLSKEAEETDYYNHKAAMSTSPNGDYWAPDCGVGITEGTWSAHVPHEVEFTWCVDCSHKLQMLNAV